MKSLIEAEWERMPEDPAERLAWLNARPDDDVRAKLSLAVCYAQGFPGVLNKDVKTALRFFTEAAELGSADAAAQLGFFHLAGDDEGGVPADAAEGVRWLTAAADKDHPEALHTVGMLHRQGKAGVVEKDLPKAVKCFQRAATLGWVASIYQFGVCKANGEGCKKEMPWAVQCFAEAAEKGDLDAVHDLAMCFKLGLGGIPKDPKTAVKWFRKGADAGSLECLNQVGQCYLRGIGLRQQPKEAARWLGAATVQGHVDATWCMGQMYALGQGVPRDETAAARCYAVAAQRGHPSASHNLATAYATGAGVARDLEQAAKWFRTAARGGVAAAKESLDDLGAQVKKQDAMREISNGFEERWSVFVSRAGVEGGTPVTAADLPVPDDHTLKAMLSGPSEDVRAEVKARWSVERFNSAFRTRMDPSELKKALATVEEVAARIARMTEILSNSPPPAPEPRSSSSSSSSKKVPPKRTNSGGKAGSSMTTASRIVGAVVGSAAGKTATGGGLNSTRKGVASGNGLTANAKGRPPMQTYLTSGGGVPRTGTMAGGAAKAARGLKEAAAAAEATAAAETAAAKTKGATDIVPPPVANPGGKDGDVPVSADAHPPVRPKTPAATEA